MILNLEMYVTGIIFLHNLRIFKIKSYSSEWCGGAERQGGGMNIVCMMCEQVNT